MTQPASRRYDEHVTPQRIENPLALQPASSWLLLGVYLLALVPLLGVLSLKPVQAFLHRRMLKEGRYMGAMHLVAHARGALVLAAVWTGAFLLRHQLLDGVLLLTR